MHLRHYYTQKRWDLCFSLIASRNVTKLQAITGKGEFKTGMTSHNESKAFTSLKFCGNWCSHLDHTHLSVI